MKVIVDELPKTKGDCIFSIFEFDDVKKDYVHNCVLMKRDYLSQKCTGHEANGRIHCKRIQSINKHLETCLRINQR